MKALITSNSGQLGPYNVIEVFQWGWRCDGVEFQLPVVGPSQIGEWQAPEPTAEEIAAAQAEFVQETRARYTAAMDAHYLAKARERDYDTAYTCALRAGYPGPFQPEGLAFALWMDSCNVQGYQVMADVLAGTIPLPALDDFIASLPELVWPESPVA